MFQNLLNSSNIEDVIAVQKMSAMNKNLWITMLWEVQEEISGMTWVNPLMTNVPHHRETSQLICKSIDWCLYDAEHC